MPAPGPGILRARLKRLRWASTGRRLPRLHIEIPDPHRDMSVAIPHVVIPRVEAPMLRRVSV